MWQLDELGEAMRRAPVARPATIDQLAARNRQRRGRRRMAVAGTMVAVACGAGGVVAASIDRDGDPVDVRTDELPTVAEESSTSVPATSSSVPAAPAAEEETSDDPVAWIPLDRYDPAAGPLADDPGVCSSPAPDPPARDDWGAFPVEAVAMPDLVGEDYRAAVDRAREHWPHQRVLLGLDFRDDLAEGTVTGTEPTSGVDLASETIVVVHVAADPSRAAGANDTVPSTGAVPMSSRLPGPTMPAGFLRSLDPLGPVVFLNGEVVGCSVSGFGMVWVDQRFAIDDPIGVMPDLVGLGAGEARDVLVSLGLGSLGFGLDCPFEIADYAPGIDQAQPLVLAQIPEPGEPVLRSTSIQFDLACDTSVLESGMVAFSFNEIAGSSDLSPGDPAVIDGAPDGASVEVEVLAIGDDGIVTVAVSASEAVVLADADEAALRIRRR